MKFRAVTTPERKLQINWPAIEAYASRWRPGTRLEVNITRKESKVSDPQRRYYWSTVLPTLCNALGYDRDEHDLVHRQLKIVYFNVAPDKRGIYREKDIPSVFSNESELAISQKTEFINWVMRKCAEYGAYVPSPGEEN